ncbi:hypothetical protein [Janthinobacterium sp.]|uniref:hypothetical protein n=1 Tax=Janthinobacterium sp. TaxID=1871054 RepID=UPI00258CEE01|nr:hypothetical protein [Janthinobacterium sp.]MCX7294425.1 hypothetical protein [Janthinobacterium sp.]
MGLAHNLIHRMCVKLHKSFRRLPVFSTAAQGGAAASFFISEKKSFKIKGLAWSQSACSQSYPHFMCGTALAVEKCLGEATFGQENPPFLPLPHFYAWQ